MQSDGVGVQVTHVPYLPEVWMVPAGLADLECCHGELGLCDACELAALQAELEHDRELEGTA